MKAYTTRYGNEYTADDIQERQQEEAGEQEYWNDFFAEQKRKETIIINGLQTEYGFTEAGAKATMRMIKSVFYPDGSHPLDHAEFATKEMKQAALNALKYYNQ